jgi:hypothetical protein
LNLQIGMLVGRTYGAAMEIEFVHDGDRGRVSVCCIVNEDPASVGKSEDEGGFGVCRAQIDYPGQGYRALFGWVQLVRSTDNASGGTAFEIDPARFFEDSPAPFCFYGFSPTLFDAPSRDDRAPLDWLAHSFLTVVPRDLGMRKQVVPLLGFSWGFLIDAKERTTLADVTRLTARDWAAHIPYLQASYPAWEFPSPPALAGDGSLVRA